MLFILPSAASGASHDCNVPTDAIYKAEIITFIPKRSASTNKDFYHCTQCCTFKYRLTDYIIL